MEIFIYQYLMLLLHIYERTCMAYLEGEQSTILFAFITYKLPFAIKILSCLFLSGRFTQALLHTEIHSFKAHTQLSSEAAV